MTVLYILDYGTIGGATRSFIEMVNWMKNMGVHPIVVTSSYNALNEELESNGIMTIAAGHYTLFEPFFFWKGKGWWYRLAKTFIRYYIAERKALQIIKKRINIKEIDLIHTNSARNSIGFRLSLQFGIPHVAHIREFGDKDFNCINLAPYKTLYNKGASAFICISQAVRNHWIAKGINKDKITVIYNGIHFDNIKISSDKSKENACLKLVIVGGVIPAKGQKLAVDAICSLPDDIKKNIFLDIIGWGEQKYIMKIKQTINDNYMSANIRLLGARSDVYSLLGDYQIGLMCSRSEGFGRTTAEYMHAQLGVIASDGGANKELITDGVEGLIFRNEDIKSLADSIVKLYCNRNLLINCSHKAYKKARLLYTTENNASKVYNVYKSLIK